MTITLTREPLDPPTTDLSTRNQQRQGRRCNSDESETSGRRSPSSSSKDEPSISDPSPTTSTARSSRTTRSAQVNRRRAELEEIPDAATRRIGAPVARPGVGVLHRHELCRARRGRRQRAAEGDHRLPQARQYRGRAGRRARCPPGSDAVDWEVELAVVIGARAWQLASSGRRRAPTSRATPSANDLSERTWQLQRSGGQWSKGKGAPGFCPLGPWLVTADSVDPGDLRLQSFVNGEPRQDSRTRSDMIFDVDQIVADLSQYVVLEPGDVILTGTPEGVALSGRFPYLGTATSSRSPSSSSAASARSASPQWCRRERAAWRHRGRLRRQGRHRHRRSIGHRRSPRRGASCGRVLASPSSTGQSADIESDDCVSEIVDVCDSAAVEAAVARRGRALGTARHPRQLRRGRRRRHDPRQRRDEWHRVFDINVHRAPCARSARRCRT